MKFNPKIGFLGFLLLASLEGFAGLESGATVIPQNLKEGTTVEQRLTALTGAVKLQEGEVDPEAEKLSPDNSEIAQRRFRRRFRRRRFRRRG